MNNVPRLCSKRRRAEQMNWTAKKKNNLVFLKRNKTWHCDATMWPYDASS